MGYCTLELTQDNNDAMVYAVKNHYWYQMYIGKCDCIPPNFVLFHTTQHCYFAITYSIILYLFDLQGVH